MPTSTWCATSSSSLGCGLTMTTCAPAARAWCAEMIARLDDDAASCTRAGDHGAASKAERQRERWAARVRDLG